MHINLTQADQDKSLLISLSEPSARRLASKKAGVRSGSLPVLAAVVFRQRNRLSTTPRVIYAAEIANTKLVRAYLRELIAAGLVNLQIIRGRRYLSPTLAGLGVAVHYTKTIRSMSRTFSQV